MNFWKWRKRQPRTLEEIEALRREAVERAERASQTIEQNLDELRRSEEELRNNRGGPGGPDDSAGAVRVC